jgi:hypothetical protein
MENLGSSSNLPRIPHGFTLIDGPDNCQVLVPTYLVPATKLALENDLAKISYISDEAAPEVSHCYNKTIIVLIREIRYIAATTSQSSLSWNH